MITTIVFTGECGFLCTFLLTLFVILVIMAHAFQPLENLGHIAVYRRKERTFKSLVIFHKNVLVIYNIYLLIL